MSSIASAHATAPSIVPSHWPPRAIAPASFVENETSDRRRRFGARSGTFPGSHLARAAGVEVRRVGKEQVFVAVGRAVAKCALGQPVLAGHRGLFEISRIDGA